MATEWCLFATVDKDPAEPGASAEEKLLQRAVAKIVALGARRGVNADQMIQMLKSGMTVCELLEYLTARAGEVA